MNDHQINHENPIDHSGRSVQRSHSARLAMKGKVRN